MRFGSVCSGIEAASVAWRPLGFVPAFYSEIEPFPCAVLAHHEPDVPNFGDMTKFQEWPDAAIDVLVGGTPCQAFSVAGLREGLADPRGQLTLTFLAVAAKYRPEWLVWENVPGVLSDREAFGSFLAGLSMLGYGWAYRILDAQYFGVAQRRRRVFVVASARGWQRAAAVLFEPASLSGHPPPRRETREGFAAATAPSLTASGRGVERTGESRGQDPVVAMSVALRGREGGGVAELGDEVAHALRASQGGGDKAHAMIARCVTTGEGTRQDYETTTLVAHAIQAGATRENPNSGPDGVGVQKDIAYTLEARAEVQMVAHAFDARQSDVIQYGDKNGPLDTDGSTMAIAFSAKDHGADAAEGIAPTLRAMGHSGSHANGGGQMAVAQSMQVRRLTPRDREIIGGRYADAPKAGPVETLRELRGAVGEEAFATWGFGVIAAFRAPEVLQSILHGAGVRHAAWSRNWLVYCALALAEERTAGAVQSVREAFREGCASQRWQPSEQLARELGAYLSELSRPGASAEGIVFCLWQASEGSRLLQSALSAVEKLGRPNDDQDKQTHGAMQVRRLTPVECEFLQGFPRNYTLIPYRGKPAADGPRYKALGNSMAVPVMSWIGERIRSVAHG